MKDIQQISQNLRDLSHVVSYQITVDRHHSYLRSRTDTHSSREMIKPRS